MEMLTDNNILSRKVPRNVTHVFQPLDLTVNKFERESLVYGFQDKYI